MNRSRSSFSFPFSRPAEVKSEENDYEKGERGKIHHGRCGWGCRGVLISIRIVHVCDDLRIVGGTTSVSSTTVRRAGPLWTRRGWSLRKAVALDSFGCGCRGVNYSRYADSAFTDAAFSAEAGFVMPSNTSLSTWLKPRSFTLALPRSSSRLWDSEKRLEW